MLYYMSEKENLTAITLLLYKTLLYFRHCTMLILLVDVDEMPQCEMAIIYGPIQWQLKMKR